MMLLKAPRCLAPRAAMRVAAAMLGAMRRLQELPHSHKECLADRCKGCPALLAGRYAETFASPCAMRLLRRLLELHLLVVAVIVALRGERKVLRGAATLATATQAHPSCSHAAGQILMQTCSSCCPDA